MLPEPLIKASAVAPSNSGLRLFYLFFPHKKFLGSNILSYTAAASPIFDISHGGNASRNARVFL